MSNLPFSETTNAGFRAAILAIAPAVVVVGHGYHPWIGSPAEDGFFQTLAATIAAEPTRWWVTHLLIAVGSGLLILAFLALRGRLREAGEERWSVLGLPFVAMGSLLYAMLPAMEFAPLAATRAGVDAAAVQAALFPWFAPILLTSAVLFGIGVVGFVLSIVRGAIAGPATTWVVAAALLVMAAARFFPVGAAQLHVGPAAGILAMWPLAYAIWTRRQAQSIESRQPTVRRHFATR